MATVRHKYCLLQEPHRQFVFIVSIFFLFPYGLSRLREYQPSHSTQETRIQQVSAHSLAVKQKRDSARNRDPSHFSRNTLSSLISSVLVFLFSIVYHQSEKGESIAKLDRERDTLLFLTSTTERAPTPLRSAFFCTRSSGRVSEIDSMTIPYTLI